MTRKTQATVTAQVRKLGTLRVGSGPQDPMRHPACGTHWPASTRKCPGCGHA